MFYCPVSLPSNGKLPKELRHDNNCFGAVEPKYGRQIEVAGPKGIKVKERLFFLLDTFDTLPFHPTDQEGNRLPRRFRVMNPLNLCENIENREKHFSQTTTKECIKQSGNIALVASGAFSKNQFIFAIKELHRLYGRDVAITIVDGREELHWLGQLEDDGEPFSQHTMTNHQNSGLSRDKIIEDERKFAEQKAIKIWARIKDDELSPVCREYLHVQTEEQFVTTFNHVSYIRLPVTDHTAMSLETVFTLNDLVKKTVEIAGKPGMPVQVIWTHCFGGKGRASSLSLTAHVMIQRRLAPSEVKFSNHDFQMLANHIWLSGGSKLDTEPDPEKKYKYNGALCRKGILEQIFASYSEPGNEEEIQQRVENLYTNFVAEHRDVWNAQVDPTDFAEEDTDD